MGRLIRVFPRKTNRTYVIELRVHEGSDEWWEEVNRMRSKERRKEIAAEMVRQFEFAGFTCTAKVVKVENS